jgi:DNA-binding NtrC family response regulator
VDAIVNVRFIAATNRDPQEAVDEGILREDLYYRLRVVPITVPALRERQVDVPVLASHFLRYYWARHRDPGLPVPELSEAATRALCTHHWKGNVRELQNVMEHTVVLAEPGATIESGGLPFIEQEGGWALPQSSQVSGNYLDEPYHVARERVLAEFELGYLTSLVNTANGNMSKAARVAGVDRTTLYRLMEKHGLQRGSIMVESDA